jgi:hypothetical protein
MISKMTQELLSKIKSEKKIKKNFFIYWLGNQFVRQRQLTSVNEENASPNVF